MQGFYVPRNKSWMDTWRLWPPPSGRGCSKSPDSSSVPLFGPSHDSFPTVFEFSNLIWCKRGASSGPALLIWGAARRWVYLKYREWNGQTGLRTSHTKNVKTNPAQVSIGLFGPFCLLVRLWTYVLTTHSSLILCMIIPMALRKQAEV